MKYISLNAITRSILQQKQLPIHYYYRMLKFSADGLREQLFDVLKIVNDVRIPVVNNEAQIPADCIDLCSVGLEVGQFVRPLVKKHSINRMLNLDSTGAQANYGNPVTDGDWWSDYLPSMNTSLAGENIGAYYGIGAGPETDTYNVDEKRGVIILNENLSEDTIRAAYISDGSTANAATRVHPYAQKTIEAYADWQYKLHSKSFSGYEAQAAEREFYNQARILRGRMSDLTPEVLQRILNRHRKATIK